MNQNILRNKYSYNIKTGVFTYREKVAIKVHIGDIAGTRSHHTGYVYIKINGKQYAAHRLAWLYMTGEWPEFEIDHVNGVKDDNRIENLRAVTHLENGLNQAKNRSNKSGVMGVCWLRQNNIWTAQITVKKKQFYLGSFANWFDAVCARKSAENKYGFHKNHGKLLI